MRAALFVAVALIGLSISAEAEVIARCGASAGHAYYFGDALAPKGWHPDSISSGRIELIRDGVNSFDVVYTDSTGGTRSVRASGFQIIRIMPAEEGRYLLVGAHATSAVVEHWLFNIDGFGRGTVAWGTIRGSGLMAKSSLMTAACG